MSISHHLETDLMPSSQISLTFFSIHTSQFGHREEALEASRRPLAFTAHLQPIDLVSFAQILCTLLFQAFMVLRKPARQLKTPSAHCGPVSQSRSSNELLRYPLVITRETTCLKHSLTRHSLPPSIPCLAPRTLPSWQPFNPFSDLERLALCHSLISHAHALQYKMS
ncbi:hypothetical protein BS47DRAFT_384501 [Hydnum rufescens UP504]|uniref:Uncharacterized protein n=1 Tax=Hydnum rufescens UP504 TaxID=1448309 RepID=A0A9P6AIZ8_9AGAM|nr:hypothetical protein BS47DRAFT_384501 [Hydnum rufescens UP504]